MLDDNQNDWLAGQPQEDREPMDIIGGWLQVDGIPSNKSTDTNG